MANIADGAQVVVPSREDKNPDCGRSKSVKRLKRLETMADELKRMKHELAVLKKKDRREGEENEEVNGSEAAANDEVDGIDEDENEEEYESEGDENEEENENEEEDENEGDENEEGSEGNINEEEGGSEGVQNEEDINGGDENQKLAARADFDNKHEQKVQEGAGREEKVEVMITESITVEGTINGDGGKGVSTNSEKVEAVMVKEGKDAKNSAKKENMPIKKPKGARKRHKTTTDAAASKEDNKSDELLNADKKETLTAEVVKLVDGMGLIFMCNAKTKQDCFRYKILGLPASKKELVAKIYKGMRLFLFDVDLKLMYGIFRAAAPGGYNIEPQAFKSAYPAQVRFHVLSDCKPLPEEKFKAAIKENYFGRNKFSNQLSSEQVKKLCKIFQTTSKLSKNKRPIGNVSTETEPNRPSKRRRRAKIDAIRTARPDPRPVQRAADSLRAKPVLVRRTSSHGRGRDSINHREAHKRPRLERERRRTPPASLPSRREQQEHSIRVGDLDPYIGRREREIQDLLRPPRRVLSPPPAPMAAAAALPYDYYYRQDPPHSFMVDPRSHGPTSRVMESETRHMLLPRDSHITEYHHHRDALSGLYREPPQSLYHAPPPAYAPTAYAPPSQSAYGHGHSPVYYRY